MMINFFLLEIWSLNSESLQYQLVASRIEKRFPEGMVRNTLFYSNFKHKLHCAKSVRIRSFSGPYFAAFRLNKERYQVSLRIQSECGKIRTRKTPNTDAFYAVLFQGLLPLNQYAFYLIQTFTKTKLSSDIIFTHT